MLWWADKLSSSLKQEPKQPVSLWKIWLVLNYNENLLVKTVENCLKIKICKKIVHQGPKLILRRTEKQTVSSAPGTALAFPDILWSSVNHNERRECVDFVS